MNLLTETTEDIADSGHTPADIMFIGSESSGHQCTWGEYQSLADFDYDNGFGAQKVASDLIMVFTDGARMERHEYDGSERWQYSKPFAMPAVSIPIRRLQVHDRDVGWQSLEEINSPEPQGVKHE